MNKNNETNYLNSSFLNTAAIYKTDKPEFQISYIDQSITKDESNPSISLGINKKTFECEQYTFVKSSKSILINNLSQQLYDKYVELADKNDKSYKNTRTEQTNIWTKFKKWIKGDVDILINDTNKDDATENKTTEFRRLITKITMLSNLIAVNSRRGPATFIVISPKFLPIIQDSANFCYATLSRVSDTIQLEQKIFQVGTLGHFKVFVNTNQSDNIILVGRSSELNGNGVFLVESNININQEVIKWSGKIDNCSENAKYAYDKLNVNFLSNLPWYKILTYKLLKKYGFIYAI